MRLAEKIPWIIKGGKNGPEVVAYRTGSGEEAIVVGSYADQFGGGARGRERKIYTLRFKGMGSCSWYDEADMTLVKEGNRL